MLYRSLRPQARPQTLVHRISQQAKEPQTQPEKMATRQVKLPPDNALLLIGIFGREDAPHALIRMPSGKIARVEKGSRVASYPVLAITAEAVTLNVSGQARKLTLP
ncbi:hypothetical protein [Tropicibacter alexandrii]|uniref:hypothetical protein n=1 Tax=Tropicibacter alexandrii TaxID=2267683 RepID=UPI000EF46EF6|nr:hypothetical protein [Tropicibacter alexandrii]